VQALHDHLDLWAGAAAERCAIAATVGAIARASAGLADLIAQGPLAGALDAVVGGNADGDAQKELDVRADKLFMAELCAAPVAVYASEESPAPVVLRPGAPLAVTIDPLDGSSNIDTNLSIGTIFGILPVPPEVVDPVTAACLQPGTAQLAAGFVVYGPRTALVLTLGDGVDVFTLDRRTGTYWLTRADVLIPPDKREYAINASNYRHWEEPIRTYVDDCIAGANGPRGEDFNMRWAASLVAEAFRILGRGGIFLYPRDNRPGYQKGRLRLVYEANPLALVMEQAGGGATDGERRILEIVPDALHQRVPLVFGARDKVDRVARYHDGTLPPAERSPLFGRRGLFRL
jgi:fructose-1,6-bisphosphatase I